MKRTGHLQRCSIGAAVAAGAAAQAQSQAKISDDVVKIGVLTDMSGLYSDIGGQGSVLGGADGDRGLRRQGRRQEDRGGRRRPPEQGRRGRAARRASGIDRDGVDMITDTLNSGVALAIAEGGRREEAHHDRHRCGVDAPHQRGLHAVHDPLHLRHLRAGQRHRQGGGEAGRRHLVLPDRRLRLRPFAGEGHRRRGARRTAARCWAQVRHPLNASDFSSFLLQAQSSKAKIIGLANAGGDTINSIKAANEFGITKNQSLAGLLVFITDVHSLGLPATQGMYVTEAWYWDLNDETRKWSKRFFEKHKKMPTHGAGRGLLRDDDVPERGQGGRHRRRRRGDEVAAREQAHPTCSARTWRCARTAAWCTTCT